MLAAAVSSQRLAAQLAKRDGAHLLSRAFGYVLALFISILLLDLVSRCDRCVGTKLCAVGATCGKRTCIAASLLLLQAVHTDLDTMTRVLTIYNATYLVCLCDRTPVTA